MPDNIQALGTMLALLADNTTQQISPQDLRIAILSLAMQHGQLSVAGNTTETTISNDTDFFEVDVTGTVLSAQSALLGTDDFDMPAAGRLRYLGLTTRQFQIEYTVSFEASSNNQELHMQLGKNGTPSDQSEIRRFVATGADVGSTAIHWITPLAQNDYVSLFVKNISGANNVTIVSMNMRAVGMIM